MKYCSLCGSKVIPQIPKGDNRERDVCSNCGQIFYVSPKIVVVCIPQWQDKILLCRRAIEPRKGYWCLPGGYLEKGETLEEGAKREVSEETFADVKIHRLFSKTELIHLNLIMFCFLGDMTSEKYTAGIESLDVDLFDKGQILKLDLAFNSNQLSLDAYFQSHDTFKVHNFRFDS